MSDAALPERTRRRLTVVLASDVAGYSRLVGSDEEGTILRFARISARFRSLVGNYSGRVFNTAGDAILAEFSSAVDAVRCALDVHESTQTENISSPPDRWIEFRIGVAVGDVIVTDEGDLLGDGVNIAARLQGIAEPGGTCVSHEIWGHVHSKLNVSFRDLGSRELKNIAMPVHAFAVGNAAKSTPVSGKRLVPRPLLTVACAIAFTCLVGAAAVLLYRPNRALTDVSEFDADRVPFISASERRSLKDFNKAPAFKAIALARNSIGVSVGEATKELADLRAMSLCNSRPNPGCNVYATGGKVVWSRRIVMPIASDIRAGSGVPYDIAGLPLLSLGEKLYQSKVYFENSKPKALAFGNRGLAATSSDDESPKDAIRRALERCGERNDGACLLYALDDQATQPLPKKHPIKGLFLFTNDTDVPPSDRQRLEAAYSGADWRAIARNGHGGWYAVNGAGSEDEAANAALKQCGVDDCAVYAIGNFLVGAVSGTAIPPLHN